MSSHRNHHSHMHHSHSHGTSTPSPSTDMASVLNTTAAAVIQAVMTTVMTHGSHSQHEAATTTEMAHKGHSMNFDAVEKDVLSNSPNHYSHHSSSHVGSANGDHMLMYFHFGVDTIILFKEWTTTTTEGLIGSLIGIILLAMLYEGIKFFRECLFKRYFTSLEYSSVSVVGDDGKPVTEVHKVARNRMFSWPHMTQTFLHVVQMIMSYFLMLIFMTYNVWLCSAVVIGAGAGYFLFGWRKATVVDITEHCH